MKTRIIALVALVAMLVAPMMVNAQKTDPLSVMNAWHEALNAYDVDAALSYFADDGTITFVPPLEGDGL